MVGLVHPSLVEQYRQSFTERNASAPHRLLKTPLKTGTRNIHHVSAPLGEWIKTAFSNLPSWSNRL